MIRTAIALPLLLFTCILWGQDSTAASQSGKGALQRALEYEIMAPCCYGGPVGDHDSDAAKQVKVQIARLLAEGKTKEEILDMYVAIYGEQILARPRAQGFNLLAYIMPPLILLIGGLLFVYFLNRIRTPAADTAPVKQKAYSDELFNKIEKEMQELNI
ncbi:MAG: cytochrome c-type biogenesis protein CcmH [Fidelibacterota bacterium]|nr:MAG: cytochrome c-type biogenesis protein CcmH [Candidatus Neomarinimicrobiota bacterium]